MPCSLLFSKIINSTQLVCKSLVEGEKEEIYFQLKKIHQSVGTDQNVGADQQMRLLVHNCIDYLLSHQRETYLLRKWQQVTLY